MTVRIPGLAQIQRILWDWGAMQLFVRTQTGRSICLEVDAVDTVGNIKRKLQVKLRRAN